MRIDKKHERFERLVGVLAGDLYRYALMLSRNETMADDLVQETFMRAWRFLHTLRDERKAKSWLMTTLRREFARQFERYQPRFDDVELDQICGARDIDPEVWNLRKAVAELPLKYREVRLLQVIGGYNGSEMSEILNLPRATVNTRLFRARQQLREALDPVSEPGPTGRRAN